MCVYAGDRTKILWDKIVFKKIAERMGGQLKFLCSGAAPLPAVVAEFMKVYVCMCMCTCVCVCMYWLICLYICLSLVSVAFSLVVVL